MLALIALPLALATDPTFEGTEAVQPEAEKPETKLSAELGGAFTTGNTYVGSLQAGLNGSRRWSANKLSLESGTALVKARPDGNADGVVDYLDLRDLDGSGTIDIEDCPEDGVALEDCLPGWEWSSQRLFAETRYDRFFGEKNSLYILGGAERDSFAGLAYRVHEQVGWSRLLVHSDSTHLVAELGADFAQEGFTDPAQESDVYPAVRVMVGFDHTFNENVAIADKVEVYENVLSLIDEETYPKNDLRIYNTASLTAKLSDRFSVKFSHRLAIDNNPATGRRPLDQTTTVNLVASIF